jgi:hypothetical protein
VLLPTEAFGGHGVVTVTQVHRSRSLIETDVYGFEVVNPEYHRSVTAAVVNMSDDAQEEPYRCTVGAVIRCTCEAGRKGFRKSSCKHKDVFKALLAGGALADFRPQGA